MTDLLTPVVNKVPGYYSKVLTALANKPPNMQIFAPSKFGINRSADLKVMVYGLITRYGIQRAAPLYLAHIFTLSFSSKKTSRLLWQLINQLS